MTGEILAALLGAVAAGILQTFVAIYQRRHIAKATLVAIATEVAAICQLVRTQEFQPYLQRQAEAIRAGNWDGKAFFVDSRADYFSVFDANAQNIGILRSSDAAKIVSFYAYCKSVIDMSRPDGRMATNSDPSFVAENMLRLDALVGMVLALGEEIMHLPQVDPFIAG